MDWGENHHQNFDHHLGEVFFLVFFLFIPFAAYDAKSSPSNPHHLGEVFFGSFFPFEAFT